MPSQINSGFEKEGSQGNHIASLEMQRHLTLVNEQQMFGALNKKDVNRPLQSS